MKSRPVPATTSFLPRRRFLGIAALGVLGAPFTLRGRIPRPIQLGLVADVQYADAPAKGTRFYRNSPVKLADAVAHFNTLDLDGCVNLGDLVDRDWSSFDPMLRILKRSRHRVYHVLGNHDFNVAPELKRRVPGKLGLRRRYYSFKQGRFVFAILDTNQVSLYASTEGTSLHDRAALWLERLKMEKALQAQTWNGGAGPEQLEWLDRLCRNASAERKRVVVFSHHPVYPANAHNAWDASALLELTDRHPHLVAWVSGHNHAGNLGERHGVPFITLQGMVETAEANSFALLRLHPDRLELVGHGREVSREFPWRSLAL